MVVAYSGGGVEFFEPDDNRQWRRTATYSDFDYEPESVAFSSSGRRVAIVWLGDVRILDRQSDGGWKQTGRISSERMISKAVFDASSDQLLITNGKTVAANIWLEEKSENWVSAFKFEAENDFTRSISSSSSGRIATGGNDGYPRIWSPGGVGSWAAYAKVRANIGLVKDVNDWTQAHTAFTEPSAVSPDKRRHAIGNVYGVVRIVDQHTGIEVAAFDASDTPRYALRFSDDGRALDVLDPQSSSVLKTMDTEIVAALRGRALVDQICGQKLRPPLSIISHSDIEAIPAIGDRLGQDVCKSRGWLQRFFSVKDSAAP
jgi:WD40 repeat protein